MARKKLTEAQIERIKIDLASGMTTRRVAEAHGLGHAVIDKISSDLNKSAGLPLKIQRKVRQRMTELEMGLKKGNVNSERAIEDAVEIAAFERVQVTIRHKAEWAAHKPLVDDAISTAKDAEGDIGSAMKLAQVAKSTAETIKIRQESERKLYGLDITEQGEPRPFAGESDTELATMLRDELARLRDSGLLQPGDQEILH